MKTCGFVKILSLILAAVLLLALAGCQTTADKPQGDLLARIKERGYITIATEGDWSPWTYHDESDALVGLDVEIGKLIAYELGVEARFEETDWDSILAGVAAGRFDLACNGVGYTEERAQSYHFSTPYVYTHSVLVVRGDNVDITSFESLNGKKTANTASSTYAALAEKYGATVTPVNTLADTFELLLAGRVDATVNAEESIADYMKQHPEADVKIVAKTPGEKVCYPVAKTDDAKSLIEEIDRILEKLRQDGRLAAVSEKYFGIDLTKEN